MLELFSIIAAQKAFRKKEEFTIESKKRQNVILK